MCSVWAKTSGCRCRFFYSGISVMSHRGGVFVRPISLSLLRSRGSNSSSGLIYFKIIYLFYSLFSQPSQLREEARQRAANQRKAAFMQWFSWRWSCSGHTLHLLPFITITEFFFKKILICLFLFISLSLTPPTTCRGHQGAQELLVLRQEVPNTLLLLLLLSSRVAVVSLWSESSSVRYPVCWMWVQRGCQSQSCSQRFWENSETGNERTGNLFTVDVSDSGLCLCGDFEPSGGVLVLTLQLPGSLGGRCSAFISLLSHLCGL